MIVTCERCATQFQLDDARVPQRGVRVRCSRCKNSFRVLPEGIAAAEPVADPPRRAREGGEEITQDIPGARSGPGPERAGNGARTAEPDSGSEARPGHGPETEESDWEFNNDTAGDLERGDDGDSGTSEAKPELPEAAPARGRLADDWFGGGVGDAPLELEDRPSAPPVAAPPPLRQRPAPTATKQAPLPPPPVREPVAAAPTREGVAPAAREIALAPDPGLQLASEPEATPVRETIPAPKVAVERRAAKDPTDELSAHTWGDLLATAEDSGLPAPKTAAPALRSKATIQLTAWLGRFGHALGSGVTLVLFGAGFYAGLTPPVSIEQAPARVAGLELDSIEARVVENAAAGTLFVVSGRLRNPGPASAPLARLSLELLDAQGHPLGGAALHAPAPIALLREAPVEALSELPRLSGEVRPGEVRSFEALVASLPDQAQEFRIVESHAAAPAADPAPAL